MPVVDSYCHIGLPRFSSAEDVITTMELFGIDRGVVVLGPQVPDYPTLFSALNRYPGRIRAVGIPFGETEAQVRESVELQISAGVSGLRVEPSHLEAHPWMLDVLGKAGLWLYAINWIDHPELHQPLFNWLERFPSARMAGPHFLQPRPLPTSSTVRDILTHPRFYAIFSRQGGMGSQQSYPHADLLPWVTGVAGLCGWDRILWGSEYPVFYWRGESLPGCRDWLAALLPDLPAGALEAYLGETAQELFFAGPPPAGHAVTWPGWIEEQFDHNRTVPLFQKTTLDLPMDDYAALHRRFVAAQRANPSLSFDQFIANVLVRCLQVNDGP